MELQTVNSPSPAGEITLYTLTNASGASVTLSSLGAGIVAVRVPDRDGHMADVTLGYKDPASYLADGPCAGKIPGRFANRIALGKFTLDGKEYDLAINNGPNALHGGPTGFMNRIWASSAEGNKVTFTYLTYTRYDQFRCTGCGKKIKENKPHNYFGPTKIAVNIEYVF